MNELDEFYSYEDVTLLPEAPEMFADDFKGCKWRFPCPRLIPQTEEPLA